MASTSNLTRAVFRAIIANRPYVVAECKRGAHRNHYTPPTRFLSPYIQRRSLFSALLGTGQRGFEGAKHTPRNLELALGRIVDLIRARRTNTRTPPDNELLDAFRFIFKARLEARRRLTRNEVYLVTEAFKYFQDKELVRDNTDVASLNRGDLDMILSTLALPSEKEKFRSDTKWLAALVFKALPPASSSIAATSDAAKPAQSKLPVYITVLARTGSAQEALELLRSSSQSEVRNNVTVWIEILKGLLSEGREKEFIASVDEMHTALQLSDADDYEKLVSFFAVHQRLKEAKQVYDVQIRHGGEPSTTELQTLVQLCARSGDIEWGQRHAAALEERIGEDDVLATLFTWHATQYSDVNQIKSEMVRLLENSTLSQLTIEPFNRLFEKGLLEARPELTEAAMDIADSFTLRPNGETYAFQLNYEVEKGDLFAAAEAFDQLSREDIPNGDIDLPILNRFLAALAFAPDVDYSLIMRVVDALLERNADLDAEALAGLCRVFLRRDELEDATGLLRHRADFYPAADRARISAVFQEFILDSTISDQRAFNAYELFRHAFPETPVEQRLKLMQSFFNRQRPDFACLVFGHMRQREDIDARPTPAAYAQCFAGIAQCKDIDGLQMVYNMLKLDLEVEPTTRIRNGLMLAYIACQMPFTAMIDHFWKIIDSREGPSYSTFEVALRACETWVPQGGYEARKIIAIMQAWNLEITKDLYDCYVGALAGQSEFENTIELIEEMAGDIGEQPDAVTIGTFYNAIPWQYRKDEVENWAKKAYPDLWQDLEAYGDEVDEEWEIRYFKFDRTIDIEDDPLFKSGQYDPLISRQAVAALEPPNR